MKNVKRLLLSLLAVILLAGAYAGFRIAADPYGCRILKGVTIGGLDVGGMTPWEARKTLKNALDQSLFTQPLSVQLPEEALTLSPEETVVRVSTWAAIRDAFRFGRKEAAPGPGLPLLPYLKLDTEDISRQLSDYAARQDSDLTQPSWKLTGPLPALGTEEYDPGAAGQTLVVTLGIPKVRMDVPQICEEILSVYEDVISACAAGNFSIALEVPPEVLPQTPDMKKIAAEVTLAPVDDSLDMDTYAFVPGSYGYSFDPEAAQSLVNQAAFGQTLEIPMSVIQPEIFAEGVYFRDVLGYCETKHSADENRNTNLRLLCEALDGYILEPGQEFSFNQVVGERTEARGYKAATAYSGSRMIKDIGGGVCQGSTTLYNCVLLADAQIVHRVCHGATVSYVPLGLDAAVNWNTKTDFKFQNNFHFPMMIRAEVSDGYVKMQLLGTDEKDYYVEMTSRGGRGDDGVTRAISHKLKYDKATGELLSKEVEAYSNYYPLD